MNIEEQVAYLMQGTEYGDDTLKAAMTVELRERLIESEKTGRPLRVYTGYDPSKADLHLGHTITMRKMRQFQELGHDITFLIGNYTARIGDPSDKDKLRPQISEEDIAANGRTYAEQAFRILDPQKTTIRYNSEWLSQLSFADLIRLASNFTVQQFLARENFKLRWERGDALYLHETFYPLMQGYDAYALKADIQVGGTDQLFNIITAGRKLMTFMGEKPNIGIIMAILPGTDGVVKMSKSLGNHIPINTDASDMYGKTMSIPDSAIPIYSRLATRWTPVEINSMEARLKSGELHPRDAKMMLSYEIAASFYGEKEANAAQESFVRLFQQHDIPEDMPDYTMQGEPTVLDVLLSAGLASSRSEGRRLVEQKGVRLDGEVLDNPTASFPHKGVLQVGKRKFVRVT